jgi:hypothetical protein
MFARHSPQWGRPFRGSSTVNLDYEQKLESELRIIRRVTAQYFGFVATHPSYLLLSSMSVVTI